MQSSWQDVEGSLHLLDDNNISMHKLQDKLGVFNYSLSLPHSLQMVWTYIMLLLTIMNDDYVSKINYGNIYHDYADWTIAF